MANFRSLETVLQILIYNQTLRDINLTDFQVHRIHALLGLAKMDPNSTLWAYPTKDTYSDCGGVLRDFAQVYTNTYHPYLAIIVCVFGAIANILNVVILSRPEMAAAPINRILTHLAVSDGLLMIEYIPYTYYYYFVAKKNMDFPYSGAVYMLFHAHASQILHTISICLTLSLAIWRYLAIGYPDKIRVLCTEGRCTWAILISYLLPIVLCIPTFFTFTINEQRILEDKVYVLYHTDLSDMFKKNKNLLRMNFWLYAVFIKLLPCCILTVISLWLISTLLKAKKRRQVLMCHDDCSLPNERNDPKKVYSKAERRVLQTTKMLIAVLVLFLITELPQGIFALLIGMRGSDLFLECYQPFGELMDILALLNGVVNFILLSSMNMKFRTTCGQVFKKGTIVKWSHASTSRNQNTGV